MVNILILSNNRSQTSHLTGNLLSFAPDLKIRVAKTLTEAEQFGKDVRLRMAFVDKDLARGQEVALAERIRRPLANRFLPIVMLGSDEIASAVDYNQAAGLESEGAAALGMVHFPFPLDPGHLKQLLEHVFVEWRLREHRQSPKIFIDQAGAARWLSEDEIVFVEYASRRVVIHTRKETIEYKYMPLQKFAAQLSSQFVQVHQSYVVNFSTVKSYNRQHSVLKVTGSSLPVPVGRSYQKRVAELIKQID